MRHETMDHTKTQHTTVPHATMTHDAAPRTTSRKPHITLWVSIFLFEHFHTYHDLPKNLFQIEIVLNPHFYAFLHQILHLVIS